MFCARPGRLRRRSIHMTLYVSASLICLGSGVGFAQDDSNAKQAVAHMSNDELVERMLRMEQRMQTLEKQLEEARAPNHGSKPVASNHKTQSAPAPTPPAEAPAAPAGAGGAQTASTDLYGGMWSRRRSGGPQQKPILGMYESPVQGLTIGAYGEAIFGRMQNPAAGQALVFQTAAPGVGSFVLQNAAPGGTWQNGFDARRLVLLPSFALTDNIIFNAEIEFEHAGIAFDPDDKLAGEINVEQLFVDLKFNQYLNWRAPGIDLVPIGFINEHHEPTVFYSPFRPELYNGLIPSTWQVPATGFYGTLMDGLGYRFQVSHSLEDFGDDFGKRTDANTVPPFPAGYAPGIDGLNALGFAHPPRGDFRQLHNTYAISGRFDIAPPFIPGLAGSVSAYYAPNVTPRGAYGDFGTLLGRTSLAMFDAEARYRMPDTGLELRGEYVRVDIGNPANLRANNDTDPTNNVGKFMDGYSGEVAYHFPLGEFIGSNWEAVPFYRYTHESLQHGGFAGTDFNVPLGAGWLQFHTAGIAVFPTPQFVLKAAYQKVIDKEIFGARSDKILGSIGFFF